VLEIFGGEVAAAVCYVKGGEAFSAKLLRGQPGRGFQSVGLDTTGRKTPVAPLPTTSAPLRSPTWGSHVPTISASLHGPLTAQLTNAVGGPSIFGGPRPFASSRGRVHRPGSWGLLSV
jgi:hypothetical protein